MAAQTIYCICSFLSSTIYTKLDAITLLVTLAWRQVGASERGCFDLGVGRAGRNPLSIEFYGLVT